MRWWSLPATVTLVAAGVACNEVPVQNLTSSYLVQIQELREHSKPAKLDILWVVDDSPSMCQEQASLSASFGKFLSVFKKYTAIDMRLAVTTTNVCAKDKPGAVRGKFVYAPASEFPPDCMEKRSIPCTSDAQCQKAGLPDSANWVCETKEAKYLYTCDKPSAYGPDKYEGDKLFSVTSACRYKCDREGTPQKCAQVFGEPASCANNVCEGSSCSTESCTADSALTAQFGGKEIKCSNVCAQDWTCNKRCEEYLHDATKCQAVCGAGANCQSVCADTQFPKQDFLCGLACAETYDCEDRCNAEFGKPTYRCLYPGGDKGRAGCLEPPPTAYCPKNGPKVLDKAIAEKYFADWKAGTWAGNPDWKTYNLTDDQVKERIFETLFVCMATAGAAQSICGNQEQGLLAAWMALDPNGENAVQAQSFLRPDAFLLIVIVSDEDDCSSLTTVKAEDYGRCSCLADTSGCPPAALDRPELCNPAAAGPLVPATYFINKFKSLKPDPAQIVFAAVVGDVIPNSSTSPIAEASEIRDRFFECKCDKGPYAVYTYSCQTRQGKADLGSRYIQVARGFGVNYGQISNICDDQGLEPSLERIARIVIPLLTRVCLPRPLGDSDFVQVYKINEKGERFLQKKAKDSNDATGDYLLIQNAPDCPRFDATLGQATENAIQFREPLEYSDKVEILYSTEPFFGSSQGSSAPSVSEGTEP